MSNGALVCPRCNGAMNPYSRAGMQIDQCQNCGGIFLDRGELERLVEAESAYYAQAGAAPYDSPPGYAPRYSHEYSGSRHSDHDDHDDDHDDHGGGYYGGRRRSFVRDLFG